MKRIIGLVLLVVMVSCEEETYIPKPPTYLRLDLPDHNYTRYDSECDYNFDISEAYNVSTVPEEGDTSCNRRIDLGPLNGTIFMRYWTMDKPLSYYINNANDEVDRHKIKATDIKDERILRSEDRVFGTMFELQGDVATPFQFYLTDSTNQFVYCEVLFNCTPNYDSLKPSLDYLKKDLDHFVNSFKWK